MTTRFRRPMLVLGTTVLVMQAVFMPVGKVYAETTMDTEEQELVELPPMKNYLEDEQISDPRFFFTRSRMQGTAEEPLQVTFFSDQEVSEARVFLPEEATLLKDQLSTGISVEEGAQPNEWIVQSKRAQNTFVLPLVFDTVGFFELFVEDTTATIEINNEEAIVGEDSFSDDASITPEKEDSESNLNIDDEDDTKGNTLVEMDTSEEITGIRSSVDVSTWEQYAAAINNQGVTTINVTTNISGNTSLNSINRNLIINGNGFTINSQEQRYRLTGDNRQLTVRNATITGTLLGDHAQFRSVSSGASNTRFIFSDIVFRGENRFLDTPLGATDIKQSVVFDGGKSSFPYMNNSNSVFVNVSDFRVINQSSVEVNGQNLSNTTTTFPQELRDAMLFSVEAGSSVSVINSPSTGIVASTVNIEGELNLSTLGGTTISGPNSATAPNKLSFGENSKATLERMEGTGAVIGLLRGGELTIAKGSEFDFVHQNNGPVINNSAASAFLSVDSERLALWDRALQNEEKASMVFSDIALKLGGLNGSEIISANNERFERLYDSAGLISYSRMSNRDMEEMNRFVYVRYENKEGESIEDDETLTGFLGDPYQSEKKKISGYQLITLPENREGEFTRESIQVTYVYQRSSVSPVDPLDPEIEVDPENKPELPEDQGQLSIDFVSSFNFGTQDISAHDQTYYAQPQRLLNEDGTVNDIEKRPNYVQISDRRPENERYGWQLAVTQRGEFEGVDGQVLAGARLRLMNQQVASAQGGNEPHLQQTNPLTLVPNVRRVLLYAQGNEATGTWVYRFGDGETAGESVALEVPRGSNPEATAYSTSLIWELSAVPGN